MIDHTDRLARRMGAEFVPMAADVETVARGLTKAQSGELLLMSREWQAGPSMTSRLVDCLYKFEHDALVERIFADRHWCFRLTSLGLAVRQYLMEQPK